MNKYIGLLLGCILCVYVNAYDLPAVNLGFTSFLDGGPLRPKPGFYWIEYFEYYHAHTFVDAARLLGIPDATNCYAPFNSFAITTQFAYQFDVDFLNGEPGLSIIVPWVVYSHISRNFCKIADIGSGFGDIIFGVYLQFNPLFWGDRPIFVHRIEFDVSVPIGRYAPEVIAPGNGFVFVEPYWAATLFATRHWAFSWRIYYLWCGLNRKVNLQPGRAVHLNYSTEHEFWPRWWIGMAGYFLRQLTDTKQDNASIPCSRERVLGIGPGAVYKGDDINFLWNIYFEVDVQNRPRGMSAVFHFIWHF